MYSSFSILIFFIDAHNISIYNPEEETTWLWSNKVQGIKLKYLVLYNYILFLNRLPSDY